MTANGTARARLGRGLVVLSWAGVPAFMIALFAAAYAAQGPARLRPSYHQPLAAVSLSAPEALLIAGVLAVPLGWSSRRPLTVLGMLTAEAVAVRVFTGANAWPMFLMADVLVFYVAATRSHRASTAAVGAVLTGWAGTYLSSTVNALVVLHTLPADLLVALLVAWICGSWIRLRQDHAEALRVQSAAGAVQAERLRIARELHDMVAHNIGVIAIQAGAAGLVIDTQPGGAREAIRVIERTSRDTLAGLRRMLVALREADDGETLAAAPGLADLAQLACAASDAGVKVEVSWHGERRELPQEIDLSAYRVIQESVTNVVRHAGTSRCHVNVDFREEDLLIEVTDEGRGDATAHTGTGYGILGMRERVGLLHGEFSAGPRPGGGFQVIASLPT